MREHSMAFFRPYGHKHDTFSSWHRKCQSGEVPWQDTCFVKYPPKLVNEDHDNNNVFGPTITDLPLRQVYYFGDNAIEPDSSGKAYGILASYDDMRFIKFWQEMELPVTELGVKSP